jgi:hypothetical protein
LPRAAPDETLDTHKAFFGETAVFLLQFNAEIPPLCEGCCDQRAS